MAITKKGELGVSPVSSVAKYIEYPFYILFLGELADYLELYSDTGADCTS